SPALPALPSFPTRRSSDLALDANRGAQRSPDCLERGLGDVMRVATRRVDVDRDPRGLREAAQHVRRQSRVALAPPSTSAAAPRRSEEHTSELQSPYDLVCR